MGLHVGRGAVGLHVGRAEGWNQGDPQVNMFEEVRSGHTLYTDRQIDRTENFTFPQLRWQAVNMKNQ